MRARKTPFTKKEHEEFGKAVEDCIDILSPYLEKLWLGSCISDFERKKIYRDYFVSHFHYIALSLRTVDVKILKEYNDQKEEDHRISIMRHKRSSL